MKTLAQRTDAAFDLKAVRLPSICVLSHREGLRTELRPRVCSQPLETATRKPPDERGLKTSYTRTRGARHKRERGTAQTATHAQRSQRAQHASATATARRKNARDAGNVDETQKGVDRLQNRVNAGL